MRVFKKGFATVRELLLSVLFIDLLQLKRALTLLTSSHQFFAQDRKTWVDSNSRYRYFISFEVEPLLIDNREAGVLVNYY